MSFVSSNPIAAAVPPTDHDRLPRMDSPRVESASVDGSHPWDLDLDQVLGNLYPDSRQRGAVVAELETLTYLHQSLVQQTAATEYLTHLEQRIFQLLGMA